MLLGSLFYGPASSPLPEPEPRVPRRPDITWSLLPDALQLGFFWHLDVLSSGRHGSASSLWTSEHL